MSALPRNIARIATIEPAPPSTLIVRWRDGKQTRVDLADWIATGGALLAPLREPALFATARTGLYGASIVWGEEDGDLAIDAFHLSLIAAKQQPFGSGEAAARPQPAP